MTKTDLTIVTEILNQLGGHKFTVMTGAKNFVAVDENTLRFSIGRNKTSVNRVEVTYLPGKDLYKMRFYRQWKTKTYDIKVKDHKVYEDVYCDQLQELFTEVTGMYTSLF